MDREEYLRAVALERSCPQCLVWEKIKEKHYRKESEGTSNPSVTGVDAGAAGPNCS
jgi:hypothetical protein